LEGSSAGIYLAPYVVLQCEEGNRSANRATAQQEMGGPVLYESADPPIGKLAFGHSKFHGCAAGSSDHRESEDWFMRTPGDCSRNSGGVIMHHLPEEVIL
jgi:hypothetical protein